MLELKNVTYEYQLKHRTKKVALKDISMRLEKGKFYTVFGVSGSGKTTCLSLLGGLDIPTSFTGWAGCNADWSESIKAAICIVYISGLPVIYIYDCGRKCNDGIGYIPS